MMLSMLVELCVEDEQMTLSRSLDSKSNADVQWLFMAMWHKEMYSAFLDPA